MLPEYMIVETVGPPGGSGCFGGIKMASGHHKGHHEVHDYGSIIFSRLSTAEWMSVAKWS